MKKWLARIEALRLKQIANSQDKLLARFLFEPDYAHSMARHPLHACLAQWLPQKQGAKILELGCGPGKYVALLSTLGFQVTGVDPYAFPTWNLLRQETSAELIESVFAEHLPFPDRYFDHAVCLGALLYFKDPRQALLEMRRVLKPGGRVVLRTVNKENLYTLWTRRKLDPASKNLYTAEELYQLVTDSGFMISKSFSYGFWLPFWTDFWWYLVCVWLPVSVQVCLSSALKPRHRVNQILFFSSPLA
jgi:SAM-dependent methyltransferase